MNFKKPSVTMLDKQKAKKTLKVFSILAAAFSSLLIATIIFLPKAKTLKGIDNNIDKQFENTISIKKGDEYVIFSNEIMQRYDAETNKFIDEYPYAEKIRQMVSNEYSVNLSNAFTNQVIHYENVTDKTGYFVCFDVYGDLFKIDLKDDNFVLSNDCFLRDRVSITKNGRTNEFVENHLIRSVFIKDSSCYTLSINDNLYYINEYDLNNLKSGLKNTRKIYKYVTPTKSQRNKIENNFDSNIYSELTTDEKKLIDPLDYSINHYFIADPVINGGGVGENLYNVFVEGDRLYVPSTLGVYSYPIDFSDINNENIVNKVRSECISKEREALLGKTKEELGIDEVTYSNLSTVSDFAVDIIYKSAFFDDYIVNLHKFSKDIVFNNKDWLAYYDPNVYNLSFVVFENAARTSSFRFIDKGASFSMGGATYAPSEKTLYMINALDQTLYYLKPSKIDALSFNPKNTIYNFANKSDVVFKGKSFPENHGVISYDPVGNSLHVTFENDRDLCVVDIKDDNIKVRYLFASQYDIAGFNENEKGDRLIITYRKNRVTFQNVVTFPCQVDIINPELYQHRTLFIILLVTFAVLDVASIVFIIITAKTLKSDRAMLKSKVIKRDFKRNKWTYVSLIPFVILLIMFCYVEAIGSISFSFFSYTADHPTYIWNDFGNYINIFYDPDFWLMFSNTFFFLLFDLILGLIPPIIFAFFLSVIKNKKLSGTLRALMFIPAVVPGIASLLIWRFGIYGDSGVLNQLICFLKFGTTSCPDYKPIKFLVDSNISRWSLLLLGFPYVGGYLIFYGGLMNIPGEYHEACKLEGLGVVKTFFKVDLPLIKPQIKYILVMTILSSAQNYERTYMLGSTGTTTLVESMYRQMKDYTNYGKASAYATIIFLLLLVPVLINFKDTKKNNLGDQI